MLRRAWIITRSFGYDVLKFELFFPLRDTWKNIIAKFSLSQFKTMSSQWGSILKHSDSNRICVKNLPDDVSQHIIFAPINSFGEKVTAFESLVAKSLSLQGHKVSILTCDSSLPACLWNVYGDHSHDTEIFSPPKTEYSKKALCRQCTKKNKATYSNLELNTISLKSYASQEVLLRAVLFVDSNMNGYYEPVIYKGINVTEHAYSSTIRKMVRGTLKEDEWSKFLFRRFMVSAVYYIDMLEKMTAEQKPDCFVCVHGIYLEHGVLVDFANNNNIRVVVHGTPYRKGTIWLAHKDTYHRTLVNEPIDRWDRINMTDEMKTKVSAYLNSKISGGRENVNYNPSPILDKEQMLSEIGLDINKRIVSVFTNTLWDAQVVYKSNVFENMLEWLYETIDYFISCPDTQLAIRIHPAESKGGFSTNQPIVEEINNKYPSLPSNIFIIAPESDVSSVLLADVSSAAIIYATKLGIELAYRKVPLIVAGETLCRGKGFSIDISSKEHYVATLASIGNLNIDVGKASVLAEKYAYHLFFNLMIEFPYITSDFTTNRLVQLNFNSLQDILPGKDRGLDVVCEGILNGKPFEYMDLEDTTFAISGALTR